MIHIPLTDEQAAVLAELLQNTISNLGMEIAATDQLDFREQIGRRHVLQEVLDRLKQAQSKAA